MAPVVTLQKGEKLYRIGVNDDCPVHQIFAGGQCFPRKSEKVTGYGSETERTKVRGAVVRMGPGQLEKCFEAASHKVVRSTKGRKSRSRIHDTRARNYRKMDNDRPILGLMYAVPLDTLENPYEKAGYPSLSDTMGQSTEGAQEAEAATKKEAAGFEPAAPVKLKPKRRRSKQVDNLN